MSSRTQRIPAPDTQPKTYQISPKSLLSLPFRLCNPPPAVGKIRSCGVTPLLQVRLEDVLERRHLPPLGLKDFEEWLLFVEMSPENLYFTLWLREYKQRYNQWKSQTAFQSKNAPPNFPLNWSQQYSSHLAMFYARAKQTFFTPGSEYELNLTSSLLAPFHEASMPHPDPDLFRDVELETWRTLDASLRRFVLGQLNNVGNARVLCGIVAGTVFCLLGCIAPLVMNFIHGDPRWSRLLALPGLWFGLTVLFASLNGLCLGIYIFGDLRQLRKFELSRPPISKPQPLPQTFRRMSLGATSNEQPLHRVPSTASADSRTSAASSSSTASTDDNIHISPAYYDADDDAMDMDIWGPPPDVDGAHKDADAHLGVAPDPYTATATFIHAFDVPTDDEDELARALQLPARHQPMAPFDFDALPAYPRPQPHPHPHAPNHRARARPHLPPLATGLSPASQLQLRDAIAAHAPRPPEPVAPATFLLRMQAKCNFKSWRLQTGFLEDAGPSPGSPAPHPSSPYWAARAGTPTTATTLGRHSHSHALGRPSSGSEKTVLGSGSDVSADGDVEKKVRRRFRMAQAVPAFRVPLARVLSPVVVRGQWEIVVRAALGALLLAWVVIGLLLAVPPIPRRGS